MSSLGPLSPAPRPKKPIDAKRLYLSTDHINPKNIKINFGYRAESKSYIDLTLTANQLSGIQDQMFDNPDLERDPKYKIGREQITKAVKAVARVQEAMCVPCKERIEVKLKLKPTGGHQKPKKFKSPWEPV